MIVVPYNYSITIFATIPSFDCYVFLNIKGYGKKKIFQFSMDVDLVWGYVKANQLKRVDINQEVNNHLNTYPLQRSR